MDDRDVEAEVVRSLERLPGFVSARRIESKEANKMLSLEAEAEGRAMFGKVPVENRGMREALKREAVYVVAYRPEFFSSFGDRVDSSSVVITAGGEVVGEEIFDLHRLKEMKKRGEVISLGGGFVVYKNRLRQARGAVKIVLPSRAFPPLQSQAQVRDAVSGSPSPPVDRYLKMRMQVDIDDPEIGTAVVGFTPVRD
jgi:hypothetical protein